MVLDPMLELDLSDLTPVEKQTLEKEEEKYHLHRFLEARAHVTGKTLEIIRPDESPDFVVRRETGNYAGVELTRVFLHSQHPDDPAFRYDWSRNPEIIGEIHRLIGQKAEKLRSEDSGWSYRLQTILVLLLMDVPLGEVVPALDAIPRCDGEHAGFREIWVADMDPEARDAFMGDIRLYGLHPKKWRGFHERANPHRKPWG